jgi:hypothetical protein
MRSGSPGAGSEGCRLAFHDAVLGREVAVKDVVFPPTFIAVLVAREVAPTIARPGWAG